MKKLILAVLFIGLFIPVVPFAPVATQIPASTNITYLTSDPVSNPTPVPLIFTLTGCQDPHANATALCNDGTYSYSKHRQGTCSHHGGVKRWINRPPN